jgi:hypothetical protein
MGQSDISSSSVGDITQQDPHQARTPGPEHKRLEGFLGHWRVEGHNAPAAPTAAATKVLGEETYDWMPGGFFLIGRWVHRFDSSLHEGISFIGHDPETRAFTADNFDNLGYHRAYRLTELGGVWQFSGAFERASWRFDDDRNGFTVNWEMSKDGKTWAPLCELRGTRLHG